MFRNLTGALELIVCTLFNPAIDVTYRVDGFEFGVTRLDVTSRLFPSGKGLNVARVVRTLGEDVAVAGLVPAYDMRRFSAFIGDLGITPLLHEAPGSARVNVTLRDSQARCVSHINSASPELPVRIQEEFLLFLADRVKSGDDWCLSGSLPVGFMEDAYARLIDVCGSRGVSCLLDTRGMPLKVGVRGLSNKTSLRATPKTITPNLTEMQEFFGGEEIKGVHQIALMGKRLMDLGVEYVFITLGDDGVIAIHESSCFLCSPPQVKTVDTVGCGDAFAAGILVAQARGFSFADTCRMAVACGSSKSMHEGPGLVTREEVWHLMEEVEISEV